MDAIIEKVLSLITAGGSSAVIVVLLLVIGLLIAERIQTAKAAIERDKRLDDIIDKYYTGNIDLTSAFKELKIVLGQIKDKITR